MLVADKSDGSMSYEWSFGSKQTTMRCPTLEGSKEWSKEERMPYLRRDKTEEVEIEALV